MINNDGPFRLPQFFLLNNGTNTMNTEQNTQTAPASDPNIIWTTAIIGFADFAIVESNDEPKRYGIQGKLNVPVPDTSGQMTVKSVQFFIADSIADPLYRAFHEALGKIDEMKAAAAITTTPIS